MVEEYVTSDGITLTGGSGIKRKNNKAIWQLIDRGYKNHEIALGLGIHRNTVYRHKMKYGRLK